MRNQCRNYLMGSSTPILLICVMTPLACSRGGKMSDLIEEQRVADGEGAFIVEEKLFDRLMEDPGDFYVAMASDSAIFNRFVDFLDVGVFTNYGEGPNPELEVKRLKAISKLSSEQLDSVYQIMNSRVITRLNALSIREID